ncbi:MAG: hypothetical protein Q4E05_06860, partial [Pseudoclavibacter sp.]|nr:hypothetical protein [Pseudoclavibacter sp.]
MTPRHAGPPEDPVYERLALERESRQVFAQAGSGRHAGSRLATAVRIGLVPVHRPVEPAPPLQAVRPLRAVEPLPEIVPESEWRPDPDPAAVAAAPAPWAPPLEDEEEPLEDFADGGAEDAAWSGRSEREVPPGEPADDAAWADPEEPEEEPLASWTNPDGSWREDG